LGGKDGFFMVMKISRPSHRAFIIACLVLVLLPHLVQAQFGVEVKLNKPTFLTYEGVEATVTIANRSGTDVVMGSPTGDSWLSFSVKDPHNNPLAALKVRSDENMIFKAGATISRTISISDIYSFSEYGNYTIAATVYHPPSQQYYTSNHVRATFTDARPFQEIPYGVPAGLPNAGQIRLYSLAILRDEDHTLLYVRLIEERTKLKLATFSLGTIILVSDPQLSLDKDNRLHVLFMVVPHIYAHVCVDTQGKVIKRTYYKEVETNRPKLVAEAGNTIGVDGGVPYDPTIPVETRPKGRSIGDKPPGL